MGRRRRVYPPGHTTRAGLGSAHQAQRRDQIKALKARPGQPCPFTQICGGLPMYATPAAARAAGLHPRLWPLDLDDFPGRWLGGPQVKRLAHRYCNRKAGQRVSTMVQAAARPQRYTRW